MESEQSKKLRQAIRKLRPPKPAPVDIAPRSAFDALLDQRLRSLEQQVDELKGRVNGLMAVVAGAVVVQVALRLLGV